jgi:hypothetical protein
VLLKALFAAAFVLLLAACAPQRVPEELSFSAGRENYEEALRVLGADRAPMARAWIAEREQALSSPREVELPLETERFFSPRTPAASALSFSVDSRANLLLELRAADAVEQSFFVELYRRSGDNDLRPVASIPTDGDAASIRIRRRGSYVLLIQPELLSGGRLELAIRVEGG